MVTDQESQYWIFDSSFDDDRDEYSMAYSVYFVGNQSEQASTAFDLHAKGKKGNEIGSLPIAAIEFDLTKRRQLRTVPPPGGTPEQ